MRKKYVIANWKANPDTVFNARALAIGVKKYTKLHKKRLTCEVVIAPPFCYLESIAKVLKSQKKKLVKLGAQDFFIAEQGAYTAQSTVQMLSSLKTRYVILGHSEVREENGDTDEEINTKIKLALKYFITPIICLGEKTQGQYKKVINQQFNKCLKGISDKDIKKIVLCYEPIWAISKGKKNSKSATPADAQAAHVYIRGLLTKNYGIKVAQNVSVVYGGSVNPKNAKELFNQLDIDGGLVGSASLSDNKFGRIIKAIK